MNRRDLLAQLKHPDARAAVEAQLGGGKPKGGNVATDGYRSGWERKYAGHLETLRVAGEVSWWGHEKIRLRLGNRAFYKCDFVVLYADGKLRFEEVKGFMREAAGVRIKVAASLYPWPFYIVKPKGSGWDYTLVKP